MEKWASIKEHLGDGVLLAFKMGDFYEFFNKDAGIVARELNLALVKRKDTPMVGVPAWQFERQASVLIKKGYAVASAE